MPPVLDCTIDVGVYVDGQPIPGAALLRIEAGGSTPAVMPTIFGMTPTLEPGEHTVELRFLSRNTGFAMGGSGGASLGAIGLGAQ